MFDYFKKTVFSSDKKWYIKHYSKFGWELYESYSYTEYENQRIGTTISGDITADYDAYNYVDLTFARAKNIPHREQLVQLEQEFETIMYDIKGLHNTELQETVAGFFILVFIWCVALCIISLFPDNFMGIDPSIIPMVLLAVAFFAIIYFFIIRGIKKKQKKNGNVSFENERRRKRRQEIYKIAKKLLK